MTDSEIAELFKLWIDKYLRSELTRKEVSDLVSNQVGVDSIQGGREALLVNCEWALRHINEKEYYTTDKELTYLLQCLRGESEFSESERDSRIAT